MYVPMLIRFATAILSDISQHLSTVNYKLLSQQIEIEIILSYNTGVHIVAVPSFSRRHSIVLAVLKDN